MTVYKFHTDAGLTGLGENPGPPFAQEVLDPYLGSDPFDHVMSTGRFNLDMACYDLMGKQLGIPAWKLLGQQRRQWVSMGWWMPCMSPEDSAAEVEEAASLGYRGLKCKARPFYDVVEQARAMQEAAPPDFRVEFDFNGALINVEKALPVLRELEKIPVVKGVEEPIFAHDVEGWRRLHRQVRIPFYLHGVGTVLDGPSRQPSGPWLGLRAGDFDGALCSHENIRNAMAASWTFASANTPILLQYVGTGITAAFACQLGAVMHTAMLPGVTASHSYEDDLIAEAAHRAARLHEGSRRAGTRGRARRGRGCPLPRHPGPGVAALDLGGLVPRRPQALLPRPAAGRRADEARRRRGLRPGSAPRRVGGRRQRGLRPRLEAAPRAGRADLGNRGSYYDTALANCPIWSRFSLPVSCALLRSLAVTVR